MSSPPIVGLSAKPAQWAATRELIAAIAAGEHSSAAVIAEALRISEAHPEYDPDTNITILFTRVSAGVMADTIGTYFGLRSPFGTVKAKPEEGELAGILSVLASALAENKDSGEEYTPPLTNDPRWS